MPKPRKYQITPNSINPTEEASVKSVLDRFRNRAKSPGEEISKEKSADFPASVDAHRIEAETSTGEDIGRQQFDLPDAHDMVTETPTNSAMVDANVPVSKTPTLRTIGRPQTETIDVHHVAEPTPTMPEGGRPDRFVVDAKDARGNEFGGRPEREDVGAAAPDPQIMAPTERTGHGAKTPALENVGAHKPGRRGDRHNNPTTERLALRPNADILKKVKHFCIENDFSLTSFFELAAMKLLDLGAHTSGDGGALAPLNNRRLKMEFNTNEPIINLYLAWTAVFNERSDQDHKKWTGKWRVPDDLIGVRYNDIDVRLIELGILQTQSNKGIGNGKIQSFQYYTGEIDECIRGMSALADTTLDQILNHHRSTLFRWLGREIDLSFLGEGK